MYLEYFISGIIFWLTFLWIISEKVNRSIIAFVWAINMAIIWNFLGFYSFEQIHSAIDFNTLLLLSGMMIIVGCMEKTGVFEFLAVSIARKTKKKYWLLLICLGATTSLFSMILDNVTTIILMAPVTLIIAKKLWVRAAPLLISQAILSNIAGVGTMIWEPPNIIIWSAAGFHFNSFLIHTLPIVIVVWISSVLFLLYSLRNHKDIKKDSISELFDLDPKEMIKKPIVLEKCVIMLCLVVIGFLMHHMLHLPASIIALLWAAGLLLLISPHEDPQKYLKRVELSVLLFFISLFILVWGLEAAGVLELIWSLLSRSVESNLLLTAIWLLWISALATSIIDNIPMTIAMVPVISYLESMNIPWVQLLWWALVFGVGFGANFTPIASTANLVVISKLEWHGRHISTLQWMKNWVPAALIGLSTCTILLGLFPGFFM